MNDKEPIKSSAEANANYSGVVDTIAGMAVEIARLRRLLTASQRRERAAVEAIRKSLRDERLQRPHLNRCSQCAKAIKDNSQRKYKFGCESLCPEALRVIVGCGFKIYEPLIPFAEDWRGPQEAGKGEAHD